MTFFENAGSGESMHNEAIFFVRKSGLLTTFQDIGRTGYQRFGVPVAGAMDSYAMQIANILVGNSRGDTCLEVTFMGPELEVCAISPVLAAITGAELEPEVNGKQISMWQSFYLRKGDVLSFGKQKSGVRAYMAVSGGYDVTRFFASGSTDIQSGFGKPIEKSTYIKAWSVKNNDGAIGLKSSAIPVYSKNVTVSIIEGPRSHTRLFTEDGYNTFFDQTFTVDPSSNRMGYQLTSDMEISLKDNAEIWSDAIPPGGIQIPPNGQPIILMADRQTTGGYPRLGTVQSTDLAKIAQLVPHGTVTFRKTSVEKAQQKAIEQEKFLRKLAIFRQSI